MNKVLIDRAVLEATLEHAEFVSGAACEADDAIRAVLVAPSGTPVMPVKAYYHEWTDLEGIRTRSVGLEVRKTFTDAPLVLESDALVQIACLEGEIAKRDARIVELDAVGVANEKLTQRIKELKAELAAIKAQEPVGVIEYFEGQACVVGIDPEFSRLPEGTKLYAAPVSEAKAQEPVAHDTKGSRKALGAMNAKLKAKIGRLERELAAPAAKPQVVIPELDREGFEDEYSGEYGTPVSVLRLLRDGENYIEKPQHSDRLNSSWWMWKRALARLNAAPVQQVSVPDGWKLVPVNATEAILDVLYSNGMDESDSLLQDIWSAMLAAAPAAPAADAGVTTHD